MERNPRQRLTATGAEWDRPGIRAARRSIFRRFRDATVGFRDAYREEPNLRFHLFAAGSMLALARALHLSGLPLLYLLGTIASVLAAELVNTAVERAVNLAAGGAYHPLARQAKDVAAGAVLVAAVHAVVAGWYLFVQPHGLGGLLSRVLHYGESQPVEAALLAFGAGALGAAAWFLGESQHNSG